MNSSNLNNNESCNIHEKGGNGKSVLAAMSGGVDSSVVCTKLCEAGYSVCGATMLLREGLNAGNTQSGVPQTQAQDITDAKSVCAKLGIEHLTLDFTERFKHNVVEPFCSAYLGGSTPNPCVICNQRLKFKALHEKREEMGLDFLATGHYARISYDEEAGRYQLKCAADPKKDQSYVLYGLTQEQLAHTLFPLGDQSKTETRQTAREHDLQVAEKPESQDICFIPDGDYATFIEKYVEESAKVDAQTSASESAGIAACSTERENTTFSSDAACTAPGLIVLEDGTQIGTHTGLMHYTTGQRKGICVAWSEPLFVLRKDIENNTLVVGPAAAQGVGELWAKNVNLIAVEQIGEPMRVDVKVNYRAHRTPATVETTESGSLHVIFDTPIKTCAIGQACVLYTSDIVVGGGIISNYA